MLFEILGALLLHLVPLFSFPSPRMAQLHLLMSLLDFSRTHSLPLAVLNHIFIINIFLNRT